MSIILFVVFIGIIIGLLYMFACMDTTTRKEDLKEDLEETECAPKVQQEEPSPSVKAFKSLMSNKYHRERKGKEASA